MWRVRWLGASILMGVLGIAGAPQPARTFPVRQSIPGASSEALALVGAKVYPSPSAKPISNGVIIIREGKIVAVGKKGKVKIPETAAILECGGMFITAGFWNSHVHLTEPKWAHAAQIPAAQLTEQLREMLTRYGFTTAFDLGSVLKNTQAIRNRIQSGEIVGPNILTTGEPIYPPGGVPIYVRESVPASLLPLLPQPKTPAQAMAVVDEHIRDGADAIKIFSGSWLGDDKFATMPLAMVRAVTAEAHRHGKLVFAHPQTAAGLEAAVNGGVDILAHTVPAAGEWNDKLIRQMKRSRIALIPTLKLWKYEANREKMSTGQAASFLSAGIGQLRVFAKAKGVILFGTDAGYMTDYDPADEYVYMSYAGLKFRQILASLTTAPASRFGAASHSGRIAPGMDADLVVFSRDPASNVHNMTRVNFTFRAGRPIYSVLTQ